MRKLADFIVKNRYIVLMAVCVLTLISAVMIPKVNIITDMAEYLPDDSSMRKGMDIMENEFPDMETDNTIRIMFQNLSEEEREQLKADLEEISYVSGVDYEADGEEYNKDGYSLYVLNTPYDADSQEMADILATLEGRYTDDYEMVYHVDTDQIGGIPGWILCLAIGMLMCILFVMCSSWVEPFLFLATILLAIVINMGTNAFLDGVSYITNSIASILQLVLSMDYSIILINRYRQEMETEKNHTEAMKKTLTAAFSSITSSSVTTIVGLLALVFMKFKIGADMGIVLAKGVLISMFCIFTALPALILLFDKWIQKTGKKVPHISMKKAGVFSYKGRYAVLAVFVIFFIGMIFAKGNTDIAYTMTEESAIDHVFPRKNSIVLLYDNSDEPAAGTLAEYLEARESVDSVMAYGNTIGKEYTAEEMTDVMEKMGTDIGVDCTMFDLIYYEYRGEDTEEGITLSEFVSFLQDDIMRNDLFSEFIDEESESQMELLYTFYYSTKNADGAWTMTPMEMLDFLVHNMTKSEKYAEFFDENVIETLDTAYTEMLDGEKQLRGEHYSLMLVSTALSEESDETDAFLEDMREKCADSFDGEYYLIGNSPMQYEMSTTFQDEMNSITLLTAVAIFIVVAVTFRSLIISLILVLIIQAGVYTTVVIIGLQGYAIYFLALLIVQCILMGATIDYAILYTSYYREKRKTLEIEEALIEAYDGSIHTILTSGLIIILLIGLVGYAFSNPAIGQICQTISKGALCATLLIIFILPGILAVFDKLVCRKKK